MNELLFSEIYSFLVILTRIGAAMMFLPAIGEGPVSPRFRAMVAITTTLALTPLLAGFVPEQSASFWGILTLLVKEIFVGLFIGLIARILMNMLELAGSIMSFEMSLSNAMVFNPAMGSQGAVIGSMLGIAALALIFTLNLHHDMIKGLVGSYQVFPPREGLILEDFSETMIKTVSNMFLYAFQMSIPMILVGVLVQMLAGLLNRLMPQLHIFFVIMPAVVLAGIFVFMLTAGLILESFGNYFRNDFANIFLGGG